MSENAILLSIPENDKLSGVGFLHQVSVNETFQCHTHDFLNYKLICYEKKTNMSVKMGIR